jgi:anti-sigma regulatory factor (Ser/Thr protein kinase)
MRVYHAQAADSLGAMPLRAVRRDIKTQLNDVSVERLEVLLLVCQELLANAIAHDTENTWSVLVNRTDEWLEVIVANRGSWREAPSDPGRGNGLRLVLAFTDELLIQKTKSDIRVTARLHADEHEH